MKTKLKHESIHSQNNWLKLRIFDFTESKPCWKNIILRVFEIICTSNITWYKSFKMFLILIHFYLNRLYLHRLLCIVILIPIIQSVEFCIGLGVKIKDMSITIKNDEVSFLDCQRNNVNGCIFDENANQTMSCIVMNYLQSHDYTLVSYKQTLYFILCKYVTYSHNMWHQNKTFYIVSGPKKLLVFIIMFIKKKNLINKKV